jgi:hypothetical protein
MRVVPTKFIWLILHTVLFAAGLLLFGAPWLIKTIGKPLAEALGGGLAATGAAGVVLYAYISFQEGLTRSLEQLLSGGLVALFDGRAARIREQYETRLKKFDRLDVIGYGLSSLREDFSCDFRKWANNSRIRILLIDPDFPSNAHSIADFRDGEENSPKGSIARDVGQFIAEYKKLGGSPNFQVRYMTCIPSVNIFRVDDEIFFGPYLMGKASRNSPTFICKRGGHLFTHLREHFDTIWNSNEFSRPA